MIKGMNYLIEIHIRIIKSLLYTSTMLAVHNTAIRTKQIFSDSNAGMFILPNT